MQDDLDTLFLRTMFEQRTLAEAEKAAAAKVAPKPGWRAQIAAFLGWRTADA